MGDQAAPARGPDGDLKAFRLVVESAWPAANPSAACLLGTARGGAAGKTVLLLELEKLAREAAGQRP